MEIITLYLVFLKYIHEKKDLLRFDKFSLYGHVDPDQGPDPDVMNLKLS